MGFNSPMDMSSREIRLPLSEVVAVLRDLNEFVVSLDRLGSRQASGTADEHTVGSSSRTGMSLGGWPTPATSSASRWTRS